MIRNCILIGLGGFLGAVARYIVAIWIGQRWGRIFPFGTVVVNVSGCFFIGFLMSLFTEKIMGSPQARLFLITGVLGAYTTFSTFEYETGSLLKDGEWVLATANVIMSVIAGFVALKLGEIAAKII